MKKTSKEATPKCSFKDANERIGYLKYLSKKLLPKEKFSHRCMDCGASLLAKEGGISEYYMVRDAVWGKALEKGLARELCIGCLEVRLNRQLLPEDFPKEIPLNTDVARKRSERLKDRMGN